MKSMPGWARNTGYLDSPIAPLIQGPYGLQPNGPSNPKLSVKTTVSQPRKHHYLPQFYLRGFSLDERSLYQIEKRNLKYYGGQIKDMAAIRDFHEFDGDDVPDPQVIEKRLADIEGVMAQTLSNVLRDGLNVGNERFCLIEFLALMRLRVPAIKSHVQNSLSSSLRAYAIELQRLGQLPPPPTGLEDFLHIEDLEFSVMNWKVLEKMFRMAGNPKLLELLYSMRATLYRSPSDCSFITCDQPVALYHPASGPNKEFPVGPRTPGVEVSFPLSRNFLLRLDHEKGEDLEMEAKPGEVSEFNRRTVIMASEYIFTGEVPEATLEFVRPLSAFYAGFEFENISIPGEFIQAHKFIPVGPA